MCLKVINMLKTGNLRFEYFSKGVFPFSWKEPSHDEGGH